MSKRGWRSARALTVVGVVSVLAVPGAARTAASATAHPAGAGSSNGVTPACSGPPGAGYAVCHAVQLDNPSTWRGQHIAGSKGPGPASSTPSGYGPSDLRSAYSLTSTSTGTGTGTETVAIVDAYNDPNAASDLSAYRSQFGLGSCTTANGCFKQVNQSGGSSLPRSNTGWGEEISLDLDMVSAICPSCHILLVEASSSSFANLSAAAFYATHGNPGGTVVAVSNSYGGGQFSGETSYDSDYTSSYAAITVSSVDGGYGVEYPAASPGVTAVGGTSLSRASNTRGFTETAWSYAGSGCSAFETQPGWQSSLTSLCAKRAVDDVSADADPYTGVAVYDTYREPGWTVFGGMSVASPLVASVYALAGNTGPGGSAAGSLASANYPYTHTGYFHDVTSGSNGSCGGSALCTAGAG